MTDFIKKFNPSDYEIKGFTNPYKPDLSARPKEPTIPMNPEIYKNPSSNQASVQQNNSSDNSSSPKTNQNHE
jgi:hypothetical protein